MGSTLATTHLDAATQILAPPWVMRLSPTQLAGEGASLAMAGSYALARDVERPLLGTN